MLKNIRVTDKAQARSDSDVQKAIANAGARLGERGRMLVRESGTEPVIRVMAEAESQELCAECVEQVVAAIRAKGYAV